MASATPVLFFAAIVLGFVAWFYGVAELIGVWCFWRWAFRHGIPLVDEPLLPVLRQTRPLQVDLPGVKAMEVEAGTILLRCPTRLFVVNTPFPLKATLFVAADGNRIVGRLPIGTTIFLASWLVGWTVGGAQMLTKGQHDAVSFMLFGWGTAALMVGVSLPLERWRMRRAARALATHLRAAG